ncbi:hypothetical protein C9890_0519 [Perkinsus sp. BL_2016]|nr:hypothetical protein C9890_0519 [Perkinsus sp. BL_2016]
MVRFTLAVTAVVASSQGNTVELNDENFKERVKILVPDFNQMVKSIMLNDLLAEGTARTYKLKLERYTNNDRADFTPILTKIRDAFDILNFAKDTFADWYNPTESEPTRFLKAKFDAKLTKTVDMLRELSTNSRDHVWRQYDYVTVIDEIKQNALTWEQLNTKIPPQGRLRIIFQAFARVYGIHGDSVTFSEVEKFRQTFDRLPWNYGELKSQYFLGFFRVMGRCCDVGLQR